MHEITTIGYEGTNVADFLQALTDARVELLIDVRALASSRRPGFAKTRLAANLQTVGIDYLHLRGLGTPADGRAAARAGRHGELRDIYLAHLATDPAQADLDVLEGIVRDGKRVALLCFEADPSHCHRSMLADALARRLPLRIEHLAPHQAPKD